MTYEKIWRELEASGPPEKGGRLRRRVHAATEPNLRVELILPERRRTLSLDVAAEAIADLEDLPQARGLAHKMFKDEESGRALLSLELADPAAADIFSVLAQDVADATARAGDDHDAVGIWTSRISRWQRLLRNAIYGLGPELQRGLYAELWVMREVLAPLMGPTAAVLAWQGPSGAPHDYQLEGGSLEVKSCAANEPQVVTINGERQLDETGTNSLHLVHVSLDIHRPGPETLIQIVSSVRGIAAGEAVETVLEDRLLDYGYLDAHESRYRHRGYTVRECRFFRVGEGFPRLVETDLPDGIGGLRYRLAIAACGDFEVERESIESILGTRT
jgi:hypothetical protein